MDEFFTLKTKSSKEKMAFLSGDPTVYGLHDFRMPKKGSFARYFRLSDTWETYQSLD